MDGIHAFEEGDNPRAVSILTPLFKAGSTLPLAYLKRIKDQNLAEVDEQLIQSQENCIPGGLRSQSDMYLKASLAYMKFLKSPPKRKDSQKRILENFAISANPRAVVLLDKLQEEGKFKALKKVRQLNYPVHVLSCMKAQNIDLDLFLLVRRKEEESFCDEFVKLLVLYDKQPSAIAKLAYMYASMSKEWSLSFYLLFLQNYVGNEKFETKVELDCLSKFVPENARYIYWHAYVHGLASPKTLSNYACMLYRGEGGDKNLQKARKFFEEADAANNADLDPMARYDYALMLHNGEGGEEDLERARECFKQLINIRKINKTLRANILSIYASMLFYGKGGERDLFGARSSYALILSREDGGDDEDLPGARKWLKQSVDKGYADDIFQYAQMLMYGEGGGQDLPVAREYFKKVANNKDAEVVVKAAAQDYYAVMLYSGIGGAKNLRMAGEYFKRAADNGHVFAQYRYAVMLKNGEGCTKDLPGAIKYLRQAAKSGLAVAKFNYGLMIVSESPDEAKGLIKASAGQGYVPALVWLEEKKSEYLRQQESEGPAAEGAQDTKKGKKEIAPEDTIELEFPQIPDDAEDVVEIGPAAEGAQDTKEGKKEIASKDTIESKFPQIPDDAEDVVKIMNECEQQWEEDRKQKKAFQEKRQYPLHTVSVSRDRVKEIREGGIEQLLSLNMAGKKPSTLRFCQTIFRNGGANISSFELKDALQAFGDLGCEIISVQGENSVRIQYTNQNGEVNKLKIHRPHGHGDNKLYQALLPYFKRFLISIGVNPEDLSAISSRMDRRAGLRSSIG